MKRPLEILKEQIADFAERAASSENKTIQLSQTEFDSFKFNFNELCYDTQYGALDAIYQELFKNNSHQNRTYCERDLHNVLIILHEVKTVF